MSKANVSRSFTKEKASEKIQTGTKVITGIASHSQRFINPQPGITELQDMNNQLGVALQAALIGGQTARTTLKQTEAAWIDLFNQSAVYVESVANGDVLAIEEAGFTPTKTTREPKPAPAQMVIKTLKGDYSVPGKIDIICVPQKQVDFYIALVSKQPVDLHVNGQIDFVSLPEGTKGKISSNHRFSIEGLDSVSQYHCIVMGLNNKALGAQSLEGTVVTS